MAGTPIQILMQFMADTRSAIQGTAKVENALRSISQAADRAEEQLRQLNATTQKNTQAQNTNARATNNAARANRNLYTTQQQLATQQRFLASAWSASAGTINRRYLSSISGLREGLYRFNQEAKRTVVFSRGMMVTLDDSSLAMQRFMMKGNLVTRTLDNMGRRFVDVGKNAQWTGRQMMVGITAPVLAIGGAAVKSAMDIGVLDREIDRLIQGNEKLQADLDAQSTKLSQTWGRARTEIKQTQAIFAQAGFEEEIGQLTELAVKFASLGDFDIPAAAEMVRTFRHLGIAGQELEATLARLDHISDDTSISLEEMASALPKVAAFTRQAGVSVEETAALLAGFTSQGIDADQAARALRGGLTKLSAGLAMMSRGDADGGRRLVALRESLERLQQAGVNISFRKTNGELRDGLEMFQQLAQGWNRLKQIGDEEGAMLVLRDLFGSDQIARGTALLEELVKSMDETTATGRDMAKAMEIAGRENATALERWASQAAEFLGSPTTQMQNQIQELINKGQQLGQKLIPIAIRIMDAVNGVVDSFMNLSPTIQNMILALVGGFALLGPVVYIAGQGMIALGTIFRGLLNPFKRFFAIKGRFRDTFEGAEEATDELMRLHDQFDRDGDRNAFLRGVQDIAGGLNAQKAATEGVTAATKLQSAAAAQAAASLRAQAAAQAALNTAQVRNSATAVAGLFDRGSIRSRISRGVRGVFNGSGDFRPGADTLESLIPNMTPDEALRGITPEMFDEDSVLADLRARRASEALDSRLLQDQVVTRTGLRGDNLTRAGDLEAIIRRAGIEIDSLDNDSIVDEARRLVDAEMGDFRGNENRRNELTRIRASMLKFQQIFNRPVPTSDPDEFVEFERVLRGHLNARDDSETFLREILGEARSGDPTGLNQLLGDALAETREMARARQAERFLSMFMDPDEVRQAVDDYFLDVTNLGDRDIRDYFDRGNLRLPVRSDSLKVDTKQRGRKRTNAAGDSIISGAFLALRDLSEVRDVNMPNAPITRELLDELNKLMGAGPDLQAMDAAELRFLDRYSSVLEEAFTERERARLFQMGGLVDRPNEARIGSIEARGMNAERISGDRSKSDQNLIEKLERVTLERFSDADKERLRRAEQSGGLRFLSSGQRAALLRMARDAAPNQLKDDVATDRSNAILGFLRQNGWMDGDNVDMDERLRQLGFDVDFLAREVNDRRGRRTVRLNQSQALRKLHTLADVVRTGRRQGGDVGGLIARMGIPPQFTELLGQVLWGGLGQGGIEFDMEEIIDEKTGRTLLKPRMEGGKPVIRNATGYLGELVRMNQGVIDEQQIALFNEVAAEVARVAGGRDDDIDRFQQRALQAWLQHDLATKGSSLAERVTPNLGAKLVRSGAGADREKAEDLIRMATSRIDDLKREASSAGDELERLTNRRTELEEQLRRSARDAQGRFRTKSEREKFAFLITKQLDDVIKEQEAAQILYDRLESQWTTAEVMQGNAGRFLDDLGGRRQVADIDTLRRSVGRRRSVFNGQFMGGLDTGHLMGGLSNEMRQALTQVMVLQLEDMDEIGAVLRSNLPDIDDAVRRESSQHLLTLSRYFRNNLDEAKFFFGDEVAEQMLLWAEERGRIFSQRPRSGARRNTGQRSGKGTFSDPLALTLPGDILGAEQARSIFGEDEASRVSLHGTGAAGIESGLVGMDEFILVRNAEGQVERTSRGLIEIDNELSRLEIEDNKNRANFLDRRRRARARQRDLLKKRRRDLEVERDNAIIQLAGLGRTTEFVVTDTVTGERTVFASYEEYLEDRRRQVTAAVDSLDLSGEVDRERQRLIDGLHDQARKDAELANLLRAADRTNIANAVNANINSHNRRSRLRSLATGGRFNPLGQQHAGTLAAMFAADLAAGRGLGRRFDQDAINRFLAHQEASQMTLGPELVTAHAIPDDMIPGDFMDMPMGTRRDRRRGRRGPRAFAQGANRVAHAAIDNLGNAGKKATGGLLSAAAWLNPLKPMNMLVKGINNFGTKFGQLGQAFIANSPTMTALFPGVAQGMSSVLAFSGPIALAIAAIVAVVAAVALTWKKWIEFARPGIEKLREAGKKLIDAVLNPIRGLFDKLSGDSDKAGEGMGNMWENIGTVIGKAAEAIASFIEKILPLIKFVMENIMSTIFIVVQAIRAVFALLTGDWGDLKDALLNIWRELWNGMGRIAAGVVNSIIELVSWMIQQVVRGANTAGGLVSDIVAFTNPFGGSGPLEALGRWGDEVNGWIEDMEGRGQEFVNDFFGNDEDYAERGRRAGEETGEEIVYGANDAVNRNGPIEGPEIDPQVREDAQNDVSAFLSAFQNQMREVVDGWKQSAMDAYDDWAKAQVEALDAKIEAIDEEIKKERERDQDLEYLRRKEELRNRRRTEQIRYQADRDLAIYEGRYDDAKQLDYDYGQTLADLVKDEQELERERQQTLTDRVRDAAKERIEIEKEELQESLDLRRDQLQHQLDMMTEYIPKNVAEAQRMQEEIQNRMREFTNGYGQIGADQAHLWGQGWASAFNEAKRQVAEEAFWAGDEAMKQFAAALGIDPALMNTPSGPSNPGQIRNAGSSYGPGFVPQSSGGLGGSGQMSPDSIDRVRRHSGGPIGNTSMAPSDVPATLQTGEYVIQRRAVSRVGKGFLDRLNQGQVYHTGGMVSAAGSAMSRGFKSAVKSWMDGQTTLRVGDTNFSADQYRNALSAAAGTALGGFGAGGTINTAGMSIAEIVDNVVKGIHPEFKRRLEAWNASLGGKFDISRGYRSMAQQAYLYDRWLRRVPGQAQAAPPGKSMHNFGLAVDLLPPRTTAADRARGAMFGLRWPMSFEPWHVEPNEAKAWRDQILGGVLPGGASESLDTGGLRLRSDLFPSGSGTGILTGPMNEIKEIVRNMMLSFGWGMDQWASLDALVQKESSWNPLAANPRSSARGLFQKMTSIHGPIEPTVQGQAQWGLNYIKGRYGSPAAAWNFHRSHNWYHKGGLVFPQMQVGGQVMSDGIAKVHAGETVLTKGLTDLLRQAISNNVAGGDVNVTIDLSGYMGSDRELAKLVDTIETKVVPKIQRARGVENRKIGTVTK